MHMNTSIHKHTEDNQMIASYINYEAVGSVPYIVAMRRSYVRIRIFKLRTLQKLEQEHKSGKNIRAVDTLYVCCV